MSEQHLRSMQGMSSKTGFVCLHQSHLAYSGSSLQFGQRMRSLLPIQALHAFRYRPGRYQHDFFTQFLEFGDLLRPARKRRMVEPLSLVRDQTAPDLDDDAAGIFYDGLHGWLVLINACLYLCDFIDSEFAVTVVHARPAGSGPLFPALSPGPSPKSGGGELTEGRDGNHC